MEKRVENLEKILQGANDALHELNNGLSQLETVCHEFPEHVDMDYLIDKIEYFKGIIKKYRETDFVNTLSSPPAIIRMNADSENQSGAGAGPGPSIETNLTRSLSSSGTSTTGHLFVQHYKGLDTKQ